MADAGTLVNSTLGYRDASSGALTAFSGVNDLTPGLKTFYRTAMLDNDREQHILADLGDKETLPAHEGRTVEWRKWNTLPDADTLVEGVIPAGKPFGQTAQTVTTTQSGLYVSISDRLENEHSDPIWTGAAEEVGASIGRTREKLVRASLMLGTNTLYADQVNTTAAGWPFVAKTLYRYTVSNAAATHALLTPDMLAQAQTALDASNAPYYSGQERVCAIHPHVLYDLMKHPEYKEMHKYAAPEELFNGTVGRINGLRFVRSTLMPVLRGADLTAASRTLTVAAAGVSAAKVIPVKEAITAAEATALAGRKLLIAGVQYTVDEATAGTAGTASVTTTANVTALENVVLYPGEGGALGTNVYLTWIFAKGAFKTIDPDGASIETIVHDKRSGIGGPLNQFGTMGGKFCFASKIVYPERLICIESSSSYAADAGDSNVY